MLSEDTALDLLRRHLDSTYRTSESGRFRVGIGDDAAVLSIQGPQVWTTDACNEGTHFLREWLSPDDLAHKSLHATLSDIPAMGARAVAALCHLTLPPWVDARWLTRFARAQARAARQARVALLGGNLNFGPSLQVVTSALGELADLPVLQSGARPGDEIWLLGELGLARAGLLLMQRGTRRSRNDHVSTCLDAFRRPVARLECASRVARHAHSCLDVSDGLWADLGHWTRKNELRAVLSSRRLSEVLHPALPSVARRLGVSALELLLQGGEDYALLGCSAPRARPRGSRVLGWFERGQGLYCEWDSGERTRLAGGKFK